MAGRALNSAAVMGGVRLRFEVTANMDLGNGRAESAVAGSPMPPSFSALATITMSIPARVRLHLDALACVATSGRAGRR